MRIPSGADNEIQSHHDPDADLRHELNSLVDRSACDGDRLDAGLRELAKSHPGHVYKELIQLLTSLDLKREDGAGSWREVVAHQQRMQERLGKAVDVRVAMLDYFLEARALKEPRIVELARFEQLRASVYRDELTGLHNYRFLNEHLRREIAKSTRRRTPLSLAMIDVDDFKAFNDRHGHEVGNRVLIAVARLLAESLRQDDVCARYGGEEFALVLSDTPKIAAREVAERTRQKVQDSCTEFDGVALDKMPTISLGVATYPADATGTSSLIRNADQALYAAKTAGKNHVRVYGDVTRSYRRVDVSLKGRFRTLPESYAPCDTSTVGEGGFCIRVGRELPPGSLIEVCLRVPDHERDLTVTGRVVYLRPKPPRDFEAGIHITEIAANDRIVFRRLLRQNGGASPTWSLSDA